MPIETAENLPPLVELVQMQREPNGSCFLMCFTEERNYSVNVDELRKYFAYGFWTPI